MAKGYFVPVMGLPGAGKTQAATMLASYLQDKDIVVYHRSLDWIREKLFQEEVALEVAKGLDQDFTNEQLRVCYNAVPVLAKAILHGDRDAVVIMEGSYRFEHQRSHALEHFNPGLDAFLLNIESDRAKAQVVDRFEQTGEHGGTQMFDQVASQFEPPSNDEKAYTIFNNGSLQDLKSRVYEFANRHIL